MTLPFISTDDLSAVLGQDVSTNPLSAIALDSACEVVRGYCHQFFNLVEDEEVYLDGTGTSSLLLPQFPVVGEFTVSEGTDDPLADDDLFLRRKSGVVYRLGCGYWLLGRGNILVTYSHGYAVTEDDVSNDAGSGGFGIVERMPSDLRRISLGIAQSIFNSAGSSGVVSSETIGSYSYTLGEVAIGDLDESDKAVLDRYRDRIVP